MLLKESEQPAAAAKKTQKCSVARIKMTEKYHAITQKSTYYKYFNTPNNNDD